MENVYLTCAVLGGTIFVCQFIMTLLGMGGGHELGADHDATADDGADGHDDAGGHEAATQWLVGVLSFRTVTAAVTFFGLGGMAATQSHAGPGIAVAAASLSGFAALYLVAWTMRLLGRLRADGTAHIERALGQPALVYLTIPGRKQGTGKVTVTVQNRTMEYLALTGHDDLPTGTPVTVVAVVGQDTVEVERSG
jgi:hypothetical protein